MANDYTYTDNFNLDLYGDNSPADLRDGYNSAMRKTDAALAKSNATATSALNVANKAYDTATTSNTTAYEAKTTAESAEKRSTDNLSALTALGSETPDKATALKNKVDNNLASLTALDADTPDKATALGQTIAGKATYRDITDSLQNYYDKSAVDDKVKKLSAGGSYALDYLPTPIYVAHRCGYQWAEQSISGAKWAVSRGFVPEIDVRLTSDGTPVLLHDGTTGRTMTGTNLSPANMTLADWRKRTLIPPVSGIAIEQAPTLAELLKNTGIAPVLIEVKDLTEKCVDNTCGVVQQYGLKNDVILQVFNTDLAVRMAEQGYHVWALYNTVAEVTSEVRQRLVTAGVEAIHVQPDGLTADLVASLHNAGLKTIVWTVDSYGTAQNLLNMGVDGITSNMPQALINTAGTVCTGYNSLLGEDGSFGLLMVNSQIDENQKINKIKRDIVRMGNTAYLYASPDTKGSYYELFSSADALHCKLEDVISVHLNGLVISDDTGAGSPIRVVIYAPQQNNPTDYAFYDTQASNGQQFAEICIYNDGTVKSYYKTGSGNNVAEMGNVGTIENGTSFDLIMLFSKYSCTIRGHLNGKFIDATRAWGTNLDDSRTWVTGFGLHNKASVFTTLDFNDHLHSSQNVYL